MKSFAIFLVIAAICISVSWAAYQSAAPTQPNLSRYFPSGALLYLQAKDFASLLTGWNKSAEKQHWLASGNYEVFSRSRLLLRLKDANTEFTKAAGLPADMNFLNQVAGAESALAIFDIGRLHFLYITKLPSANTMESTLWQARSKFETRNSSGVPFFYRRDPESDREVAFAIDGDYLLLSTREDLLAGALQLIQHSDGRTSIESEPWWSQSVAAAGTPGDVRMVLNLEKIIPSPYFRSYWVQQNITEMKQYSAAVSDLFREENRFREERVLLKKSASNHETPGAPSSGPDAVADLFRLVPPDATFYRAQATPSADECMAVVESKILAPRAVPIPVAQIAPQVQPIDGQAGASSDLETRIDQPPVRSAASLDASDAIKNLFEKNPVRAILQIQSTEQAVDRVFVRIRTGLVLLGESEWNEAAVRAAFADFARPAFSIGQLGLEWRAANGVTQLNGLWNLALAARGKYLIVSDNPPLVASVLSNLNKTPTEKPATLLAEFDHEREKSNFSLLTSLLDDRGQSGNSDHSPAFFSENLASLSATLGNLSFEKIVIRDAGNRITQTVTYEWTH